MGGLVAGAALLAGMLAMPSPAVAAPNLVASKTVNDSTPEPGKAFTFTIRYRCASTFEDCTGATLTDTIPDGMTIVNYSKVGGLITAATKTGNKIDWTLKSPLTAGSTGLATVTVKYPACAEPGFDPAPESNTATFAATNGSPASITTAAVSVNGDPVPTCQTGTGGSGTPSSASKGANGTANAGGAFEWQILSATPPPPGAYTVTDTLPQGLQLGVVPEFLIPLEIDCGTGFVPVPGPKYGLRTAAEVPAPCTSTGDWLTSDFKITGALRLRWSVPAGHAGGRLSYHTWVPENATPGTKYTNCAVFSDNGAEKCGDAFVQTGPSFQTFKYQWSGPGDPLAGAVKPGNVKGPMDIQYGAEIRKFTGWKGPYKDPVIIDLLDPNLEYVPPSEGGTNFWEAKAISYSDPRVSNEFPLAGCDSPTFTKIDNFQGTGRTLLRWEFIGCNYGANVMFQDDLRVTFTARVKPTTPPTTVISNHTEGLLKDQTNLYPKFCAKNNLPPNDRNPINWWEDAERPMPDGLDYDGDGNTSEQRCPATGVTYTTPVLANAESDKWVLGALDTNWSRYPASGDTDQTGTRQYELYIRNVGNTPLKTIDLIDIMPHVGDTAVTDPATARGSQWGMELVSLDSFETALYNSTTYTAIPPAELALGYSSSKNPCRWDSTNAADPNRLTIGGGAAPMNGTVDGPAGCTPTTWTDSAAGARSFAIRYRPATSLAAGATMKIGVSVKIKAGEEPPAPVTGKIAWNSFGWSASTTAAAPDDILLSTEPIQVGLKMTDTAATASIGDYVWLDTNHDGKQNEVGTGIAGVTVRLYKNNVLVDSTLTDASGGYRFWGLAPNATDYSVRLDKASDYTSGPLAGLALTRTDVPADDAVDNDATLVAGTAQIASTPAGAAGSHTPTYDFGFWLEASLGDYVWEDTNGDGAQQTGELPVAGATVRLYSAADNSLVGTTTTNSSGAYLFDSLAPGTYYLIFDRTTATSTGSNGLPHSGYRWTTPDSTGSEFDDSDVNTVGRTPNITLVGGQNDPRWDAGLNPTPLPTGINSIGNYTWIDVNGDGLQGPAASEPPLAGVTVTLFDNNGPRESTTTDSNGLYRFINLPDGDYWLRFDAPAGFKLTQRLNAAEGDDNDSDVYVESGLTATTTLGNGGTREDDMTWDAGFTPVFSLGNLVWDDIDNSGTFNAGDAPLEGIKVQLYAADGTTEIKVGPDGRLGTADDAAGGVVTNATGNYLFTNLAAGGYVVKITPPTGYLSSTGVARSHEPGVDADTNPTDHDDNGTLVGAIIASGVVNLSYNAEPTGEGLTNGWPDATPDANGNYTVDFGIYKKPAKVPYSIGNRVWFDTGTSTGATANDGIYQKADEAPAAGVKLELWAVDAAGVPTGAAIASVVTGPGGEYRFDDVNEGRYVVKVTAANFAPGGVLEHYRSSTNAATAYLLADDERDHGVDGGTPATDGVLSSVITIDPTVAPVTEDQTETTYPTGSTTGTDAGDLANNLTVDLGFYAEYDLALIKTTSAPALVAPTANVTWQVRVLNQGQLPSGTYTVTDVVPAGLAAPTNISDSGVWDSAARTITWTVAAASQLAPSDGATGGTDEKVFSFDTKIASLALAPYRNWAEITVDSGNDPDSTPGGAIGNDSAADPAAGTQPDDAVLDHDDPTFDNNTATPKASPDEDDNDYSQIGVEPYAIGNIVWFDAVPDGIRDPANPLETPVAGSVVRLFTSGGTEVPVGADGILGTADDDNNGVTTGASGLYYFDGLAAGEYYVTFTAPTGYSFTTNTPATPDAINDSNPAPATGQTPNFVLSTATPAVDTAAGDPGTLFASRIDRTIDAGLVVKYSLGNRVWFDADNSGDMGATESGVGLVVVNLLDGTGNPVLVSGVAVTDTTDAQGFYRFDGLLAGNYIVEIAASNFAPGGALAGGFPSTGAAQEANPNTDGDINDNGLDTLVAGAIRSGVVTLGPGILSEPTGEVVGQLEASGQGGVDGRGNMTVDFGIYVPTYAVGNIVWFDADRDGIQDGGVAEPPVAGAIVKLFRVNGGTEVPVGPDGVLGTADDAAGGVTTTATGLYYFDDLPGGDYYVVFTAPADMSLTTNAPAAADALNDSNPDPLTGRTPNFTLSMALPVVSGAAGDPATLRGDRIDRTIDAGLVVVYSLGNRVWFDADNSGAMNGAETPVDGVLVNLLKGDGTPYLVGGVAVTDTTSGGGYYRFDNLPTGDYIVEIAASNFAAGAKLYGGHPSTGANQEADPDSDVDVNDNGLDTLVAGAIRSAAVTLGAGQTTEPTAEAQLEASGQGTVDARANMTVDFGIYVPRYTLGNLVWSDFDDDGVAEPGEAPIRGVTLHLLMDDPANPGTLIDAVDADGKPVADKVTGADGLYEFSNLLEGTYVVVIPAGQAPLANTRTSGTPNASAGNDVDGDNNGVAQPDGSHRSGPVVLGPLSSEPTNEVDGLATGTPDQDGSADDALHNWSVDFGFFRGVRIGNLVWLDGLIGDGATYDNGVVDAGETPLTGVTVELWSDNGDGLFNPASDTRAQTTSTDSEGNYWFEAVTPGAKYFVAIPTIAGPTGGLGARSSTGQSTSADAADNDDDGAPVGTYISVSALFTAPALGASPTGESDTIPAADGSAETEADNAPNGHRFADTNSDLRLDFGFVEVPIYRLGNLVWIDANRNGLADAGEDPVVGVTVELYSGGVFVDSMPTGGDGKYLFDNLTAGTYEVRIPTGQTVLRGYFSTAPDEANADANGDNNDNGSLAGLGAYWTSGPVALGDGDFADEPTTEVNGLVVGTPDDDIGTAALPDDRSNLTVDFGFYLPIFALGNEVWFDLDDSGTIDNGEAYVPDAVVVNLLDGSGNPYLDNAGNPVTTTTTGGRYLFDGLFAGDYIVEIAASNFAPGGPLAGYESSTGQTTGDALANDRFDHGDDIESDGVRSAVITLTETLEPAGEVPNEATDAPDTNANMTADFGFLVRFSLGNEVWIDLDDSGLLDNGEAYVPNDVVVNLLHRDGTPVLDGAGMAVSTKTVGGKYLFDNLLAGTYIVELAASNFADGGLLDGYRSSTLDAGDTQTDQDDNGAPHASGAIRTGEIVLGGVGVEPASENPTSPTTARDTNSDLTVDLGVVPLFAIGNEVWFDLDDSGNRNGTEVYVPDGVVVRLLNADRTPVLDAAGQAITTTTTGGLYVFDRLIAGSYFVELAADNFGPGGRLAGYRSSTFTGTDDGADSDDNGAPVAGGGISSPVIVIGPIGAEGLSEDPTSLTDAVDANADLTVDFGLVPFFAIGNEVWIDANDSGVLDEGEVYVPNGVIVNLLKGDGTPATNSAGTPITTITVDGRYVFDNLLAGDYIVEVAASNFAVGGPLEGYRSSTGQTAGDAAADDRKDHGDDVESDGVRSTVIKLSHLTEPTVENPNSTTVAADSNANMTIDFGVFRPTFSLGNQIWYDLDDDGVLDAGEPLVADGLIVSLFRADGTPAGTTQTSGGAYLFDDLNEGSYYVEIDRPFGYRSSTPTELDDVDGTDHGNDAINIATPVIRSVTIALTEGDEPTGENPDNDAITVDTNENLTVDLGIVPLLSLGNEVWFDVDDSGTINNGEAYVPNGVVVNLLHADGTPVLDSVGDPVTTTTFGGMYLFTGLLAGDYMVEIPAVTFAIGGQLEGWSSSTGQTTDDTDRADHGATTPTGAVRSGVVSLGFGTEPAEENPTNDPVTPDANSNLTVDLGLVYVAVGNRVWIDVDGDGRRGDTEPGVGNVVVELWASDGTGPIGAAPVAARRTDGQGYYLFAAIAPGTYVIRIPASQFTAGKPLFGYISTEGNGAIAPDPSDAVDNDDNGTADETTGWVQTLPFEVRAGATPTAEGDLAGETTQTANSQDVDANTDLTIDLGFVTTPPLSLGNRVWFDTNNNGLMDAGERPVDGVTVQLFRDANADGVPDGDVFQTDVTADGGYYLFVGLAPGNYIVVIPASNFASGGPLAHTVSSTGSTPADGNVDVDDSGIEPGGPAQDVRSSSVKLSFYDEPTAETQVSTEADLASDNNSNLTVDFGFYPLGSLGDYVWDDVNRDGKQDAGEPGVDGVKVNLYDVNGTLVATTTTTGGGKYLFEDLVPGGYTIEFVISTVPTGFQPTTAGTSDEATDSDGDIVTGRTAVFTVVPGGLEPRVDFGIHRTVVDLTVTKTVEGAVSAGRDSSWKLVVSNKGPDTETGTITVTDNLPSTLTYVSGTGTGWTCSAAGQTVTCTTDADLAVGQSLQPILIVAKVAAKLPIGTEIVNGAKVTSPADDGNIADNASLAKAVTVKAAALPGTGASVAAALLTALLLLGAGLGARRLARRRRPAIG